MADSQRVNRLRSELLAGRSYTRTEASEEFGITGSTFRWVIKSMKDQGVQLTFVEEPGRRGTKLKRWTVCERE